MTKAVHVERPKRRPPGDVQLSRQEVADHLGILVTSLDVYKQRGTLPEADGYIGRSPWWWRSTIDRWNAARPTPGYNEQTHGVH